jgi:hypothetical protein
MSDLIGKKIVALRQLTKREMDDEGWDEQYSAEVVALMVVLFIQVEMKKAMGPVNCLQEKRTVR